MKKLAYLAAFLGLQFISSGQEGNFIAYFWGENEIPPNHSTTRAQGSFYLDGNFLNYIVSLSDPFFMPTDAGIYGPARPGTSGPMLFDWPRVHHGIPDPNGQGGGLYYSGGINLTAEEISQLEAGLWYVNIKSAAFPNGEIRGQICPQTPDSDCDFDGVPNKDDLCPNTPPNSVTDKNGCSIEELVPCDGPWKDHHAYVEAVKNEAFRIWREGSINAHERNFIVEQAQDSCCGKPAISLKAALTGASAMPPNQSPLIGVGNFILNEKCISTEGQPRHTSVIATSVLFRDEENFPSLNLFPKAVSIQDASGNIISNEFGSFYLDP